MNRREYLKHFTMLFSGTAAAQVANLLSYPFLARIYSPSEFGLFAIFLAVSAIPAAIACGRFDLAVPTAPKAGRFAILWLCLIISAGMGCVSAIGGAIYWVVLATEPNALLPGLLGLCVFLTGFCTASTLYLMRHDRYRISSFSVFVRTGCAVAIQLAFGLVSPTASSLILGFVLGIAAQALLLGWAIWTGVPPGRPRLGPMRAMARRFKRQVMVDIPSTLIAAVSNNLLTFILSALYGQAVVGLYAIGNRIAAMPLQLFNDALGQVFFQKAARAQQERGHFWNEMKFNLLTSGMLSLAVLVGIWLFARPFITLYLGAEWEGAADILLILAPMLAIRSLCMSIATAVFVLGRAHWLLAHNVAGVALLGFAYLAASLGDLPLDSFLMGVSALMILEYAIFAAILVRAARANALESIRKPAGEGNG
ncbi:oligosaccharide flippase family protein [Flavobacterium sp.]|uniref:oligosaccharide flippase family protein n=1 Tax=Flavobacterium sp. TaxID=239 RepID=UPI0032675CFA